MKGWHKTAIAVAIAALAVLILLAVASVLVPQTVRANPDPSWWDTDWDYRKRLTFDNSGQTENLVNFPVLVKLTPDNFTYAYCAVNGSDIRFIDADDSTALDYHFERWTYNGTSWMWVEVPQIDGSSSTDYIWLYYGNSGAVDAQDEENTYNNNFMGVWHLNDGFLDSTSYSNNGTNHGSTNITAKIAAGQYFDGNDYIDISGVTGDISTTNGTIEAWVKMTSSMVSDGQRRDVIAIGNSSNDDNYISITKTTAERLNARYRLSDTDYNAEICNIDIRGYGDTWKQVVGAWNTTHVLIYENGVLLGTINRSADITSGLDQATIGADASVGINLFFDGIIDEVRISDIARSADWIKAQYLSMNGKFVNYIDFELTGWGWCPDEQRGIGNVSFPVGVNVVKRTDATDVSDIRFIGTLNLIYTDNTTRTFSLNLTGVRVRSLFNLRQHEVDINGSVWEASWRGTWLTWNESGVDKHHIICEGDIMLPHGDVWTTVKPYYFLLRTQDVDLPAMGEPSGDFSELIEYIIDWGVRVFDGLLTDLSATTGFWDMLGDVLDQITAIIKEVRDRLVPYIP